MDYQIITTPGGERLVLLPEALFNRLTSVSEDVADVAAYDAAKRKLASGEEELLPAEFAKRLIAGENPIRVWRDYRGLSSSAMASQVGIAQGYLSQIESGKRAGTVDTLKKIAGVLRVSIDDLV